jgi:hypothetical protein
VLPEITPLTVPRGVTTATTAATMNHTTFTISTAKETVLVPPGILVEWPQKKPPPATPAATKKLATSRAFVSPYKLLRAGTGSSSSIVAAAGVVRSPQSGAGLLGVLRARQAAAAARERDVAALEEKLRSAMASDKRKDVEELTAKWARCSRQALRDMQQHEAAPKKPDGSRFTMAEILTAIGVAPEAVGFDVAEDRFIDDDDDDD